MIRWEPACVWIGGPYSEISLKKLYHIDIICDFYGLDFLGFFFSCEKIRTTQDLELPKLHKESPKVKRINQYNLTLLRIKIQDQSLRTRTTGQS